MCALYLYSLFITKVVKLETLTYTHYIYDHVNHAFCFYNLLVTKVAKLKCLKLFICTKFYDVMCALYLYSLLVTKVVKLERINVYTYHVYDH